MSTGPAIETIHTEDAGRRYGRTWALRHCSIALPQGSVTAVVGPNGAGKTTLLNLLAGVLPATEGQVTVAGAEPAPTGSFLAKLGFVAQDCPLYREFSVSDLLHFGRAMNPSWDQALALERLRAAEVPLDRKARRLSGGQRAQVALALAVAKRPEVLLLDEPLAALDPIARREFLRALLETAGSYGITVVLSSHLIGELARACDHLVVIRDGLVRLAGELDDLVAEHYWLSLPAGRPRRLPAGVQVVAETRHERHTTMLVRASRVPPDPELAVDAVGLEDLVMAYLERPQSGLSSIEVA
jgi:ABC-2 type transport system ATP-binding protein